MIQFISVDRFSYAHPNNDDTTLVVQFTQPNKLGQVYKTSRTAAWDEIGERIMDGDLCVASYRDNIIHVYRPGQTDEAVRRFLNIDDITKHIFFQMYSDSEQKRCDILAERLKRIGECERKIRNIQEAESLLSEQLLEDFGSVFGYSSSLKWRIQKSVENLQKNIISFQESIQDWDAEKKDPSTEWELLKNFASLNPHKTVMNINMNKSKFSIFCEKEVWSDDPWRGDMSNFNGPALPGKPLINGHWHEAFYSASS